MSIGAVVVLYNPDDDVVDNIRTYLPIVDYLVAVDNSTVASRVAKELALLPGTSIGNNCIVGACAVVKGILPDGSVVVGNPAKIIKKTSDLGELLLTELYETD